MPKFSYKILDYDTKTRNLSVLFKTDDPKVKKPEEVLSFECPELDNEGKVSEAHIKEIIMSLDQNQYWDSWNHENTPNEGAVNLNSLIGTSGEKEYNSSTRIWVPPVPPPPPAPEDDLVSSAAEEWSWLTSKEFDEWDDFRKRVKALEDKSG